MSINYKVFKEADSYSICFLVNSIKEDAIRREYLQDLNLDDVLLVEIPKDPERSFQLRPSKNSILQLLRDFMTFKSNT